jgi:hypothetical protein
MESDYRKNNCGDTMQKIKTIKTKYIRLHL